MTNYSLDPKLELPIPSDLKQPVQGGGPMGCGCGVLIALVLILFIIQTLNMDYNSHGMILVMIGVIVLFGVLGAKLGDGFFVSVLKKVRWLWPF